MCRWRLSLLIYLKLKRAICAAKSLRNDAPSSNTCCAGSSRGERRRDQQAAPLPGGGPPVTPELRAAAKRLVAGDSAAHVAAGAVRACEQLTSHLARLVGEAGIRTLLARSAALTSARFPWLSSTIPRTAPADSPWAALRAAMELQDPHTASEAFADLLSTFVELLGRMIGEGLVVRLLQEVWPGVFPDDVKETT